ncbi:Phosphoribosylglycinamide formyltransferase [Candidatus Syntrophocurvum alkaliphilum]|uniref:Phosphoribosylglycinamide formyltransferase n=1 Tax=Candidatus Syntrophocurvum alkaliphilum TaxID=2293317 RepID=A0A6I6DCD6_9FIRM|nr:phosphoribosylglycinamide formyltransferase [Candidatus Syntrophocurvum alkaliphilum]QGT98810.1 Phosphoribosylglycinamide formyltransferase [Candidatus Syntrophocurvum alkaliphilum]
MKKLMEPKCLRIAVLASGRGSNFDALSQAINKNDLNANIHILISDKENAPALQKATQQDIKAVYINPKDYPDKIEYEKKLLSHLQEYNIDLIVLAGYMRLVGATLLNSYKLRILNIHPALLPAFPGLDAQKQALDYGVRYSGCTVHFVDEGVDTGPIIMQAVVPVKDDDTEESLSQRILAEEHKVYWQAVQAIAEGTVYIDGRKVYIKD